MQRLICIGFIIIFSLITMQCNKNSDEAQDPASASIVSVNGGFSVPVPGGFPEGDGIVVKQNEEMNSFYLLKLVFFYNDEELYSTSFQAKSPGFVHNINPISDHLKENVLNSVFIYWRHRDWESNVFTQNWEGAGFMTHTGEYTTFDFGLEYDHQVGYDLRTISGLETKLTSAFNRGYAGAWTTVTLHPDQATGVSGKTPVPVEVRAETGQDLIVYVWEDNLYTKVTESEYLYEGYLLSMKNMTENTVTPPPASVTTGITYDDGPGAISFVFWESYPDDRMRIKTTIHELGHNRGGLTDEDLYPGLHDGDCVMERGPASINKHTFCHECELTLRSKVY